MMMIRTILVFILLTNTSSYSQKPGVNWERTYYYSISYSTIHKKTYDRKQNLIEGSFSNLGGITVVRVPDSSKTIHFETGLSYLRKGFNKLIIVNGWGEYGSESGVDSTLAYNRNYFIQLPFGIRKSFKFGMGHFSISTLINFDLQVYNNSTFSKTIYSPYDGYLSSSKRFQISPGVSSTLKLGVTQPIGDKLSFTIEAFFNHDLWNMHTGKINSYLLGRENSYTVGFQMGLTSTFLADNVLYNPELKPSLKKTRNAVYLEGGGNGIFYSVNYEMRIINSTHLNLDFRVGAGYYNKSLTMPAVLYLSVGKSISHLEFGIGVTSLIENQEFSFEWFIPSMGYRLETNNKNLYRIFVSPLVNISDGFGYPWLGVAYGRRF